MDIISQLRGRLQQAWLKDLIAGRKIFYRRDNNYVYIGDIYIQSIIPATDIYLSLDKASEWSGTNMLELMRGAITQDGFHPYTLDRERIKFENWSVARLKSDDKNRPLIYLDQSILNAVLPSSYRQEACYYADDMHHVVIYYYGKPIALCTTLRVEGGEKK